MSNPFDDALQGDTLFRPKPKRSEDPNADPFRLADHETDREPSVPRIFIREPGWQIKIKVGSERMFCHTMHPGEDYYHRIADGELYLQRGDERICLPCADRHDLLRHEPKPLRPPVRGLDRAGPRGEGGYELRDDRTNW
jgi:hypothetical protein